MVSPQVPLYPSWERLMIGLAVLVGSIDAYLVLTGSWLVLPGLLPLFATTRSGELYEILFGCPICVIERRKGLFCPVCKELGTYTVLAHGSSQYPYKVNPWEVNVFTEMFCSLHMATSKGNLRKPSEFLATKRCSSLPKNLVSQYFLVQ